MADYRQLAVWQRAHQFTVKIYNITRSFPRAEMFGLVSQVRRSAVSIGSNLAEGRGRSGDPEFRRFIQKSRLVLLRNSNVNYSSLKISASSLQRNTILLTRKFVRLVECYGHFGKQ